jgi:prepilin peptidase CpaA
MQGGLLSYGLVGALAIALVIAAYTDLRRREIDNWLNVAIGLGAPLFWYASGLNWVDLVLQVGIALMVFLVLFGLFSLGWMGGGDVKLLSALALWIHPLWFLQLLVWMSIAGGVLTIIIFAEHKFRNRQQKIKIPYGVAISAAGIWVIATQVWPALSPAAVVG